MFKVIFFMAMIFGNQTFASECKTESTKPLSTQVAIVWGASQGIGAAIAKRLGAEGAHVYLLARNESNLKKVTEEIRSRGGIGDYMIADITNESDVKFASEKILSKHGRVDILVQNVGIYPRAKFEDITNEYFDKIINTNLRSNIYAIQAVLPSMKKANYGRILLISSTTGNITGIPGHTVYSATKGAMTGFIKTASLEFAPYGITINSIQPGYIASEGIQHLGKDYLKKIEDSVPVGRMGTSEEVASISFFMVHPDASYVTGTNIVVDGGLTIPESHFLHVVKKQ